MCHSFRYPRLSTFILMLVLLTAVVGCSFAPASSATPTETPVAVTSTGVPAIELPSAENSTNPETAPPSVNAPASSANHKAVADSPPDPPTPTTVPPTLTPTTAVQNDPPPVTTQTEPDPEPAPTYGQPDPHTWYRLTNNFLGYNRSLDTYADTYDLFMGNTDSYTGQYWRFTPVSDGYYRLSNNYLGQNYSLDINGGTGQPFMGNTANFSGQMWRLVSNGDGTYRFVNMFLGEERALDTYGDTHQPFMGQTGNYSGQFWTLTPIDSITTEVEPEPEEKEEEKYGLASNINDMAFVGSDGNTINALPNAVLDGSLAFDVRNQDDCPTCITQIVLAVGGSPQTCAYNDIPGPFPGTAGLAQFQLIAPAQPGTYEVSFATTQHYNCPDALADFQNGRSGYVLGTIIVQAEEVRHSLTVSVGDIDINGQGNSITTSPSALLDGSLSFDLYNQDDCPTCITQIVLAVNGSPQACAYNDIPGPFPGTAGLAQFQLTAPAQPGTYEVSFATTQHYNCPDALADFQNGRPGYVLGTIIVQAEEVNINGWNTSQVFYDSGVFTQLNGSDWVEENSAGSHAFVEIGRDEWSVYLYDAGRDVGIQLDLWTKKVMYTAPNQNDPVELYAITDAR